MMFLSSSQSSAFIYKGHEYEDPQVMPYNILHEVSCLVQLYTGYMFHDVTRDSMVNFLRRHHSNTFIPVIGILRVRNITQACKSAEDQMETHRKNIALCFENDRNTTACLFRQGSVLTTLEQTVASTSDICHQDAALLREQYDEKLTQFNEMKRKKKQCVTELCQAQDKRDADFQRLQLLQSLQ